jgi:hypothetical protein
MKRATKRGTSPPSAFPSNYQPHITEAQCEPLAAMLPRTLPAAEIKDIFDNFCRLNLVDDDVDKTNHRLLRKKWNDIGLKSVELSKLLSDPGNFAPRGMQHLKVVHGFFEARFELIAGLQSIELWAGRYLDFLEQLAKDRRGGRSRSREFTYALLINLWVSRGGRPSISAVGPLATFLAEASTLIFKEAPDQKTIPGIVSRAKKVLSKLSDLK